MPKPARRPGNLPADLTSFVGRRRELNELKKTLATSRLTSLVGPGGVGKTRLAIRSAAELARGFRDGAWLAELAEIQDPALVPNAVLAALDLRDQAATEPQAILLDYLHDKELLLVIDNCEHLLAACAALVVAIGKAAPGVKLIATSREPLLVAGEHVLPVPPLNLPESTGASVERLRQNEAASLFIDRAAAASGGFELTPDNHAAVAELCRRLDGLPLAIELAAVRTRVLSPDQIVARLSDRFDMLTGGNRVALPRQQTLRTTIDWSYDMLRDPERALLMRLCVFAGDFGLDAVEAISPPSDGHASGLLDLLSSLVDKSLVLKTDAMRSARYRLHETMREYALLKLREAGEEQATRDRFAAFYASTCARSVEEARYELVHWLEWMDAEIDNIRSILQSCAEGGDKTLGMWLAGSLGWYWLTRATTEGVRWLEALVSPDQGDSEAAARAYFVLGFLTMMQVRPEKALPALTEAARIARSGQHLRLLSQTLAISSIAENMAGDHRRALESAGASTAVAESNHDEVAVASALQAQGFNAFIDGDLARVTSVYSEAARISRRVGDLYTLDFCLMNLGFAYLLSGEIEASKPLFAEALDIARRIDHRTALCYLLDAFAITSAASGSARIAAQLLGAADALRAEMGGQLNALLAPLRSQAGETAAVSLGAARFESEVTAGRNLGREVAIALALGAPPAASDVPHAAGRPLLGKREADVARLVGESLSNKEIGTRLFISERTVESHVRSILNKLGFDSRVQIATWIASETKAQ